MFIPKTVIFEEKALEYDKGKEILKELKNKNIEIKYSKTGRVTGRGERTPNEMYFEGKNTLVIGIRKSLDFQSCKPSAHYQLPLVSGCMGMCEYCYLNTQMGKRPYTKVYVNTEEILNKAEKYSKERLPEITVFEGAATSDPIPVEPYSHSLKDTIEFFGKKPNMKFRFVTKFADVDSLVNLNHNGNTTIRFSINTDNVIKNFEHRTPLVLDRLEAAKKIAKAGYSLGFIIAPVFIYEGWEKDYLDLLKNINTMFKGIPVEFEVISHRFTKRAKDSILSVFSNTTLPMVEENRKFKYGQFGYGKYIYKDEELQNIKKFFRDNITKFFGEDNINYII
ncbi:spore photoproduct lyase [Clostridium botulinum]|uniref:Spore photoproduct lyase n=1 Tax=Clostridium botulinum TaxID=1491 RepID=A0AAU8YS95_CLOBO|nr:spore photoproduct lyase [Clostridium sporogenes]AVP62927.1 spore photoproduct lyase [Clostridium botulinum]MCF4018354.1 spore photoproduct lyase [Clostridium sporogenes]NFG01924.1 spore photoproduct lyase [Clostridium sporogenes]